MPHKPPKDLPASAKKLWQRIYDESEFDEAALLLLDTLAQQYARMMQAREELAKDGLTVADRFQQRRPHPCCAIERDAAAAMMRAWRLLGFDQEPAGAIGRPPGS